MIIILNFFDYLFACGAHGGGERCAHGSSGETLMERGQWGDPDVDGRIILRWIFRKWEGVETGWI